MKVLVKKSHSVALCLLCGSLGKVHIKKELDPKLRDNQVSVDVSKLNYNDHMRLVKRLLTEQAYIKNENEYYSVCCSV